MKFEIGNTVRFIWKCVNWQGKIVNIQPDPTCLFGTKLDVAVEGYPNMFAVPSEFCVMA